jgi:hypothetical protein
VTRRDGEEVRAIVPVHPLDVDHPQVDLVDEGRRTQRVVRPFTVQVVTRPPAQLVVDERRQPIECRLVPAAPRVQEGGDAGLNLLNRLCPMCSHFRRFFVPCGFCSGFLPPPPGGRTHGPQSARPEPGGVECDGRLGHRSTMSHPTAAVSSSPPSSARPGIR